MNFTNLIKEFNEKGFVIKKFNDQNILKESEEIIDEIFCESDEYYKNLSVDEFREIILKAQEELNKIKLQKKMAQSEEPFIKKLVSNNLSLRSIIYLRAVRPFSNNYKQEQVDFHRETFYSDYDYTKFQYNMWVPLKNVTKNNCIKYIPYSHLIKDSEIKTEIQNKENSGVKQYSAGHKLGLLYKPKKIIEGVNLESKEIMYVPKGSYAIFSPLLIHGDGKNFESKIRLSVDVVILDSLKIYQTKLLYASNKPEFVPINQI